VGSAAASSKESWTGLTTIKFSSATTISANAPDAFLPHRAEHLIAYLKAGDALAGARDGTGEVVSQSPGKRRPVMSFVSPFRIIQSIGLAADARTRTSTWPLPATPAQPPPGA
jgi:hypothetical protein